MVLSKLYSNALMASLNSRVGAYEHAATSDSRQESRVTSRRFNTAQFTSVGIPVTTDGFEWVNGSDGQSAESVRLLTMRAETGAEQLVKQITGIREDKITGIREDKRSTSTFKYYLDQPWPCIDAVIQQRASRGV